MTIRKVAGLLVVFLFLCGVPFVRAEQPAEGDGGLLQGVMDALGAAAKESLQEQMDEWAGTYKGRLGEVQLVERRGNAIVLDVTYNKVKRSDGVYVQGEVLSGGVPIEGFTNTLTQVSGKRGRVRLTLSRTDAGQDDWGLASPDVVSDQIKLYMVRETHPDHPFGSIVYDLPKTWTGSNEIETPELQPAAEDVIELADETETGSSQPAATAPVLAGTVLKPVSVRPATVVKPATTVKPATVVKPVTPVKPIATIKPATQLPAATGTLARDRVQAVRAPAISEYDFYGQAGKAQWRSRAGVLTWPGRANDARGFVRQVARGNLHAGNAAIQMLQTHPQWVDQGYIAGFYPSMVLAPGVRFKAIAGFLQGAGASDGAKFTVQVYENGRYHRVYRRTVRPERYAEIDVDLSRWAGKKINLILRVDAGGTSTQDWAVWVKPRLTR